MPFAPIVEVLRTVAREVEPSRLPDLLGPSRRELVGYLTKNLVVTPVLVVGTFRSDELHRRHPLLPALGEMLRSPHVARIDLEPFERDEVAAELEGILGEPPGAELVRAVRERSDGNAFYIEELVAAGVDGSASRLPASLWEASLGALAHATADGLPHR